MSTKPLPGISYANIKTAEGTEITLKQGIRIEPGSFEYRGIFVFTKGPAGEGGFELSRQDWAELIQLIERWQPEGPFI
jgi:hypothetical protein